MQDLPKRCGEARARVEEDLGRLSKSLKLMASSTAMEAIEAPETQSEELAGLCEQLRKKLEEMLCEAFGPHVENAQMRCEIKRLNERPRWRSLRQPSP